VSITGNYSNNVITNFGHDYIGTLYIEGTISEGTTDTYDHQYSLNAIDAMMNDDENKGMILYVNTPGGTVYASDELYLKIKEYQEETGRPVYSSMQSQATSGGYYISAPCQKIIANRNCWTGSIGITIGTLFDVSEFLSKLGVSTTTITAGANKSMGSEFEPLTEEQRAIFQSLVDESYEQFVGIVAQGRNMSVEDVKVLADGRIYTAQQALENGLIDAIGTYDEAIEDMKNTYELEDVCEESFIPATQPTLMDLLGVIAKKDNFSMTDVGTITELLKLNNSFQLSYISQITK
jgi:protease-4